MRLITSLFTALLVAGFLAAVAPNTALAACTSSGNSSADQVKTGIGVVGADCSGAKASGTIPTIVNLLAYILGIVAIIMIIFGGFQYITSGGDGNRVKSAKNTLIYASIGLIIAAMAEVIAHFVLTKSAGG